MAEGAGSPVGLYGVAVAGLLGAPAWQRGAPLLLIAGRVGKSPARRWGNFCVYILPAGGPYTPLPAEFINFSAVGALSPFSHMLNTETFTRAGFLIRVCDRVDSAPCVFLCSDSMRIACRPGHGLPSPAIAAGSSIVPPLFNDSLKQNKKGLPLCTGLPSMLIQGRSPSCSWSKYIKAVAL